MTIRLTSPAGSGGADVDAPVPAIATSKPLVPSATGAAGALGTTSDAGHSHPYGAWDARFHGLTEWSNDPYGMPSNGGAHVSGTIYGVRLKLRDVQTIGSLWFFAQNAGSGLVAGQSIGGLYDASKTLIGKTADLSSNADATKAVNSTGTKNPPLVAQGTGLTNLAAADVLAVILCVGTTPVGLLRGLGAAPVNLNVSGESSRVFTADTGVTALPTNLGALTALATGIFMGIGP